MQTLTTAVDESRSKVENLKDENKALLEENDALEQDLEDCEDKLKSCRELVDTKVKKIEEMLTAIVLHILRGENNYPAGYEIDRKIFLQVFTPKLSVIIFGIAMYSMFGLSHLSWA